MRKILLITIVILLLALGYNMATNGLKFGNFTILSIKQVEQESQTLKDQALQRYSYQTALP